jgi:hypothetical protein
MCGGPLIFTTAPISNHQTSRFSLFKFKIQNLLWVIRIWGF